MYFFFLVLLAMLEKVCMKCYLKCTRKTLSRESTAMFGFCFINTFEGKNKKKLKLVCVLTKSL